MYYEHQCNGLQIIAIAQEKISVTIGSAVFMVNLYLVSRKYHSVQYQEQIFLHSLHTYFCFLNILEHIAVQYRPPYLTNFILLCSLFQKNDIFVFSNNCKTPIKLWVILSSTGLLLLNWFLWLYMIKNMNFHTRTKSKHLSLFSFMIYS